jgi:hypothetical protein
MFHEGTSFHGDSRIEKLEDWKIENQYSMYNFQYWKIRKFED